MAETKRKNYYSKADLMNDPKFQDLWYRCHSERTISQRQSAKQLGISIPTFMKYSKLYAERVIIEGCMNNPELREHMSEIKEKYNIPDEAFKKYEKSFAPDSVDDIKKRYGV